MDAKTKTRSRRWLLGLSATAAALASVTALITRPPRSDVRAPAPRVPEQPVAIAPRVSERSPALREAPVAPGPRPSAPELVLERPLTETLHESAEQRRKLYEASEKAVTTCMGRRGLAYTPEPYQDVSAHQSSRDEDDADQKADRVGYGLVEGLADGGTKSIPPSVNEARLRALPEPQRDAWYAALRGPERPPPKLDEAEADPSLGVIKLPYGPAVVWDRGSCLTEAVRSVHGDDYAYMRLSMKMTALVNEVRTRVESEPDYNGSVEQWRSCMKERGLSFEEPEDVANGLMQEHSAGKLTLDALRTREVELADADSACQQRAQMKEKRRAIEQRIERAIAGEHEDDLAAYRRMQTQALERAEQLLQEG